MAGTLVLFKKKASKVGIAGVDTMHRDPKTYPWGRRKPKGSPGVPAATIRIALELLYALSKQHASFCLVLFIWTKQPADKIAYLIEGSSILILFAYSLVEACSFALLIHWLQVHKDSMQ